MIGLSLSLCIADIIEGLVDVGEVEVIVTGIRARPGRELEAVLEGYKKDYWARSPNEADRLVRRFLREGRIEQPRLGKRKWPNIKDSHWVESRDQITWTGPSGLE